MTYEHQEESNRKIIASNNLKRLRGKIYNDSETFDEYQMTCAVNDVHHKKFFDRFWYYYLCKNYGQAQFNIMVSFVFCFLVSIAFIAFMNVFGLSIGVISWIVVLVLINFLATFLSCWTFNTINRTTKYDYLP